MTIGAGIAIAGVWLFAAACAGSKTVSGFGMVLGIVVAGATTAAVIVYSH